jgi:hypothetical protein
MSDRGVWGVALESLGERDRDVVEVVEFARFADLVPFVCAAYKRGDVSVSSVFDLESGYEVEVQLSGHEEQPPCVTLFPRSAGRWLTVWPESTSDERPPTFEAVSA